MDSRAAVGPGGAPRRAIRAAPSARGPDRRGPDAADGAPRERHARPSRAGRRPARERHQPDYAILVAVVALAAIGILMVYSSSAITAYIAARRHVRDRRAADLLGARSGILAMVVVMRIDYRWLRLASVPVYVDRARPARPRVRARSSTAWSAARPAGSCRAAAGGPPGRVREARAGRLPRPLDRQRGPADRRLPAGTVPFLLIAVPGRRARLREPDLGTTVGHRARPRSRCSSSPARASSSSARWARSASSACLLVGLRGYQIERIRTFLDPWADPLGTGFHTIQGLLALGLGGIFGAGLGESQARRRAVPAERLERLHLRDHRRGVRVRRRGRW